MEENALSRLGRHINCYLIVSMKTKRHLNLNPIYIVSIGCMLLLITLDAEAFLDAGLQQELELLNFINEARHDPLSVAEDLGIDIRPFLEDFPEWRRILSEGVEPVSMNGQLYRSASLTAESMMIGSIPISDYSCGNFEDEILIDIGYSAKSVGVRSGALAFNNLIDPSTAVRALFKRMLRDEFDRPTAEGFVILNPDYREVGIKFKFGKMELNEGASNVFLAVCEFANPRPSAIELELVEMFNQARRRPFETSSLQGTENIDSIEAVERPPLRFNPLLYITANTHAVDMLNNGYFSHTSLEGVGPGERIEAQGYLTELEGEIIRLIASTSFIDPVEAAKMHVDRLVETDIIDEFQGRGSEILNPAFEDIGISFIFWEPYDTSLPELSPIYEAYYGYLIVCNMAVPESVDQLAILKGLVYSDKDKNRLYGFNEGIVGVPMIIESGTDLFVTFTDRSGGFDFPLPPGLYQIYSPIGLFKPKQALIDFQDVPHGLVIERENLHE